MLLSDFPIKVITRISLLFLWLCAPDATAQVQPSFFVLGEKEFDGVQIYDVIQDNALNYWIATDHGIYRYNSYTFSKVNCEGAQALSAFGFVKNQDGVIYCYNLNNQIVQIRDDACSVFYELKPEERASDIYLSITHDNELLIITHTVLLFGADGKRIRITSPHNNYYAFPFMTANRQTISHIADSDSILVYADRKFTFRKFQTTGVRVQGVLKFFVMNGISYAISTVTKDIFRFDETDYSLTPEPAIPVADKKEFYRFYNENNQLWIAGVISGVQTLSQDGSLSLSSKYYTQYLISDVFHDREGNVLLSTFNHGILVIPDLNIPDVLDLPAHQSPVSIHTDHQLGLLIGTLNGQLLSYKDGAYRTLSDSGSRPIQSVFSWPEFPFILFDDGHIKMLNKETGEIVRITFGSLKDAVLTDPNTIYLALNTGVTKVTWKGGTIFESARVPTLSQRCYAIDYSPVEQSVYVATSTGVRTIDRNGAIEDVLWNGKPLFANDIACSDQQIYIATNEGLIVCANGVGQSFIQTRLYGQPVGITKMQIGADRIYSVTPEGFIVFDLNGNNIAQLNTRNGFSTNRIYDFEAVENEIRVCHSKGIQLFPDGILQPAVSQPGMTISAIMVNDRREDLLLSPKTYSSEERKLRFTVSSPTLRNQENIRYHYQLSGYDESWFIAEYLDHEILYNALAPGEYTFTVKAENAGVFSDPVSYSFAISSPFYSRWWFSAAIALVLLLIVTGIYRYRLSMQEKKAQLANELHASRLTAIQSQMNPHFIFNALNSIQDLVLKGDVDNSYTFITKFSNLVRRTLNYSDKDFIEFEQEIKLIELYLSLEKLRFRDELEFTIDTGNVEDILIPPMLIQPFIENALVHGLLHKEGKKHITIRFSLHETLTCTIEDNGVGRAKAREIKERQRSEHESFSGQAIRKRFHILSEVFKNDFGFVYTDMHENGQATGTRVRLSIPVKHRF